MRRLAMISVHECPLAASEGKERGGINVYVHELSKSLAQLGWTIDIYTRIQDTTNPRVVHVNDHIRVIHIPNGPQTVATKNTIFAHLDEFTRSMSAYMRKEQISYDLIHAHYYLSGIVARNIAHQAQPPTPWIMTFHTLGRMKLLAGAGIGPSEPAIRIPQEESLARETHAIITASASGKIYMTALYGAVPERVHVISPGVDTTLFRPGDAVQAKKTIGADPDSRMVLAVGRLDPVKGFDVLLYAIKILFSQHPALAQTLCVCIVGGEVGEPQSVQSRQRQMLKRLQQSLRLDTSVRFIPARTQEQLVDFYNAADVVVMPSHYESFGMVALEAIACDTPVIATDVTGISALLSGYPKGHVVSANNPIMLAKQILHVLTAHDQTRTPSQSVQRFDWNVIGKKIDTLYRRVLTEQASKR